MTGRDAEREEIELAILLASPIYDTTTAIDAVERIVRKRAAAELRAAADAAHDEYSGWEAAAVVRDRADALDPS